MNITLTQDLLLIRPLPDPEPVTTWGFVLPATAEHVNTPLRGLVLAAGPGRTPKLSKAALGVIRSLERLIELTGPAGVDVTATNAVERALEAQAECLDRIPMTVRVGDTVIYSKHGFQTFRIDGENLVVTQEASILGVIEK